MLSSMNISLCYVWTLAVGMACCLALPGADASEVYKWTDENGQVHYGDRISSPTDAKQIKLDVQSVSTPASKQPSPRRSIIESKSRPADPSLVKPGCMDLINRIAKVKPGVNWEALAQEYNATCPGIAYECKRYRTHPENNQCTWIERTGGNILHTYEYE